MKRYLKIQNVRENDIIVNKTLTLPANVGAFKENDTVSVTELLCGLQTHVRYNSEDDRLDCFSKSSQLSSDNKLCGFYDYVRKLDIEPFKRYSSYEFYGEWLVPNKCDYNKDKQYQWYLFSVYNHDTNKWLPQSFVKGFATKYHLNYVHELYFGPFLGWDHVFSLSNNSNYGPYSKGVVIKNQTALEEGRNPHVLKYVKSDKIVKTCDSKNEDYLLHKKDVFTCVDSLITKTVVIDICDDLFDKGILPDVITKNDMCLVSNILPKAIYDMCPEQVKLFGYLGKYAVMHKTMQIVREHVLHA